MQVIPLFRLTIPLSELAPVEINPVNRNDMVPSWGIFIRAAGWPKAVPICAGMRYGEAAELAAMINYRRSAAAAHAAPAAENFA